MELIAANCCGYETVRGFKTRLITFMEDNLSEVTEPVEIVTISRSP